MKKMNQNDTLGSTDFPKMSEQITDLNILQSRKTYGRNKNLGSLLTCSENSESSPAFVKELYAEETSASVTTSSYGKNNTQKDVNPKISLFNDADIDYNVSSSVDSLEDQISSPILPTTSPGLNYQRTRKNLKNNLNKEQYNSEKKFELPSREEISNSEADDANKFKSACDFLDLNQAAFSIERNSFLSKDRQANHTRSDVISNDDHFNGLPQKSSKTSTVQVAEQSGKVYGKEALFENPLINQSIFPIIDLVKKFSVRNNQAPAGNVKSYVINTGNLDVKKGDAKPPSISVRKRNTRPLDKVEKKVYMIDSVGNTNTPKNRKQNIRSLDKVERNVGNTNTPKKKGSTRTPSDAVQNRDTKSVKVLTKYVSENNVTAKVKSSVTHATPNLDFIRNVCTGNIQSDHDEKQTDKVPFIYSNENAVQNQFPNNIPIIYGATPTVSQETTPLAIQNVADNHSIQNNQTVSCINLEDLVIPGPSMTNLSNNCSSMENNECDTKIKPRNSSFTDNHYIQNNSEAVAYPNLKNLAISGPFTSKNLSNNHSSKENNDHNQGMRSGSFASLGVSIEQYANVYFQKTENMCILQKQAIADEIFSKHPSLRDITVKEFCNFPGLADIFYDYLTDCVHIPPDYDDVKEGYDFPENFETENLLSVLKDFVHSIIYHIVPKDGPKPSKISYLKIFNAASHMSLAEIAIMLRVFEIPSNKTFKMDDVLSRLNFVAMLVIFYKYKNRQIILNLKK